MDLTLYTLVQDVEEELQFHWGEGIEKVVKHVKQPTLITICHSTNPEMASKLRTRKDAYQFIASQDALTQGLIFNEIQSLLANPTAQTCTATWLSKRKREEDEKGIRNIRSRLDVINAGLELHGI